VSPIADAHEHALEFGDFALMPGSGVREGFDAAGIDGRLDAAYPATMLPASVDHDAA